MKTDLAPCPRASSAQRCPFPQAHASTESLYSLAHQSLSAGRLSDATALFRLMMFAAPLDERTWLGIGLCHEKLGQMEVAVDLYSTGNQLTTDSARCWLARARVLAAQALNESAECCYESAIEIAEQTGEPELRELALQEKAGLA